MKIWRLYFLVLLVEQLESYDVRSPKLVAVREALASIGLTDRGRSLRTIVTKITAAVRRIFSVRSLEGGVGVDPESQVLNGIHAKVIFGEPSAEEEAAGLVSVDQLYEDLDEVMETVELRAWIVLDRLDIAFTSSPDLEARALRALFRAYALIGSLKRMRLKIFLRSDIWKEITSGGFRESSHLVRELTLEWDKASLLKLIVQRARQSSQLLAALGVESDSVLQSGETQSEFFYQVFPAQVGAGSRQSTTFDWALSRCSDGKRVTAPRELIHLFTAVKTRQLARIESGHSKLEGEELFEAQSFKEAHPIVSSTRLERTLYAEYPWLTEWLEDLRGERTQQNLNSLSSIWGVDLEETAERVKRLVEIGFFEERIALQSRQYWVPFLYRPALELVQRSADT